MPTAIAATISPWVERCLPPASPDARALDLACGSGRHSKYLAALGYTVLACDRDTQALATLADVPNVTPCAVDLEAGIPWPLDGQTFDCIVVTNYLHRPALPWIFQNLAPGGLLIYETFMQGNARYGRPTNPDFLLAPDELFLACRSPYVALAFEQGRVSFPQPAMLQRLLAWHDDQGPMPTLPAGISAQGIESVKISGCTLP